MTATEPSRSSTLPRLLRGLSGDGRPVELGQHLALWGAPPQVGAARLIQAAESAGLRGHGGAWFPAATKWRAVAGAGRHPVVVANGAEGEPASAKDALLLDRVPHLVLDGAAAVARAVGARQAYLFLPVRRMDRVRDALDARRRSGIDELRFEIALAPNRFIAGQETAVVDSINGGHGLPRSSRMDPVWRKGVRGAPTLVHNVETMAHIALLARFGPEWYCAAGHPASPGTVLLTLTRPDGRRQVIEAVQGATLGDAIGGIDLGSCRGVLLGGYGGAWVDPATAARLPLTEPAARSIGATLGAGIVVLLPPTRCPLVETAHVVRYLDTEKADQCGPCVFGLAQLRDEVAHLALSRRPLSNAVTRILGLCDLLERRGACHHPDGAARLVRSALRVFSDEVDRHLRSGPCIEASAPRWLPVATTAPAHAPREGLRW